jgi:hypothetical protein
MKMGEADKKRDFIFTLVLSAMVLGVYLCNFVINTDLKASAGTANNFQLILAHVFYVGAVAALWIADKIMPASFSKVPLKGVGFALPWLAILVSTCHNL